MGASCIGGDVHWVVMSIYMGSRPDAGDDVMDEPLAPLVDSQPGHAR